MKKIYLALSITALSFGVASAQVDVTGTVLGTTTVNYPNLASAFAAVNGGVHTGDITIVINSSTVEPGTARLNPSNPPASYSSVEVRPGNANIVVEAAATAVVELRGADGVTINGNWSGSGNPGSRDLTFRNTLTGLNNAVVWLTSSTIGGNNGATSNQIRNCNIEGVSALETAFGIVTGGSGLTVGAPAVTQNNFNSIQNNYIIRCNTGIAISGAPGADVNGIINGNVIGSLVFADAVGAHGISVSNVNGLQVSRNIIRGLIAETQSPLTGIDMGNAIVNTRIYNNRIHDLENGDENVGAGAVGIYMAPTNGNNNRIYNNQIHSVHCYGRDVSQPFTGDNGSYGIAILSEGDYRIAHNTVYMNVNNTDPGGGGSAALYIGPGVDLTGTAPITLLNNILSNTITSPGQQYSVYSQLSAVFDTIDYNLYNAPGDLGYMTIPTSTLADWKTLTLQDKGSVSGSIALSLIADAVQVDATNSSSWLANGRAVAMGGEYTNDINNTARYTAFGYPNDMGAAEFIPTVIPPVATASAAPSAGATTSYWVGNRKIAEIEWDVVGTVPATVDLRYYSGEDAPNFPSGDDRIQSWYSIEETGGAGYGARVKFYYTYAENRGVADALLQVMKDTSGGWTNMGGSFNPIDFDGRSCGPNDNFMTTLGNFTLGNHPLAINLMAFSGKTVGTANQLSWTTSAEDDMSNFDVMRSEDGINFKVIGTVAALNTDIKNDYSFRDATPAAGTNYYRLKMNVRDGYEYSNVVALKNGGVTNIDITSLYPNPATSTIAVGLTSVGEATVTVQVTDIAGKTMITNNSAVKAGSNEVTLDVSGLAAGIYMIKATLADGTVSVQKFVKQ